MARPMPRLAPVTTATGWACWDTTLPPARAPRRDRTPRSWSVRPSRSMGDHPKKRGVLRVDPSSGATGALDVAHGERELQLHPRGRGAQVTAQQLLGAGEPVGDGVGVHDQRL